MVTALSGTSRVAAALLGGWVFVWGFVTLAIVLLLRAGMPFSDARTLAYLLAFLVYLAAMCGSIAARRAWRAWLALAGGGAAMTALAWWLARTNH
jgi:hypothetical protein